MTASSVTFSISDLAKEFALTTRAIRFYEDEGLIAPGRNGRTRVYGGWILSGPQTLAHSR